MTQSLTERLQRLQKSVQHKTVQHQPGQHQPVQSESAHGELTPNLDVNAPDAQLTELGFCLIHHSVGSYWLRIIRYDVLTRHGKYRFAHLTDVDLSSFARLLNSNPVSLPQLRFYDTETTGLGTGAGTFAFLHTIGRFDEDEFCLYQYFVDEFSAEVAVLTAMEEAHFVQRAEMANQGENVVGEGTLFPILVTFNGKSFDWPLLQARRVMYRLGPLTLAGHLDLLHISRRFWRRVLEKVSLVAVEQHALGLERHDDLPGKEAPNRYFQYASDGDASLLAPVFEHNAMDVCSLVGVLSVIANMFQSTAAAETTTEYMALAKYYDEWDEYDVAEQCYELATQRVDADWRVFWLQSLFFKRQAKWEDAVKVWLEMTIRFPQSVQPLIELAKHAEHRLKDYAAAMIWTERAIACYNGIAQRPNLGNGGVLMPHRAVAKQAKLTSHQASDRDEVKVQLAHRLNRVRAKEVQRNLRDDECSR